MLSEKLEDRIYDLSTSPKKREQLLGSIVFIETLMQKIVHREFAYHKDTKVRKQKKK